MIWVNPVPSQDPYKRETEAEVGQMWCEDSAHLCWLRRWTEGPWAKKGGGASRSLEEARSRFSQEPPGDKNPSINLLLPQWDRFQTSDLQNYKTVSSCCWSHYICDNFLQQPQETNTYPRKVSSQVAVGPNTGPAGDNMSVTVTGATVDIPVTSEYPACHSP